MGHEGWQRVRAGLRRAPRGTAPLEMLLILPLAVFVLLVMANFSSLDREGHALLRGAHVVAVEVEETGQLSPHAQAAVAASLAANGVNPAEVQMTISPSNPAPGEGFLVTLQAPFNNFLGTGLGWHGLNAAFPTTLTVTQSGTVFLHPLTLNTNTPTTGSWWAVNAP